MNDEIQRVIDEICRIDPSFRDAVRGVEEADVLRMQELLGRPLPAIYRSFLRVMGDDWGIPLPKADFRCARVIEYYEAVPWRPRHGYTLIGLDNTGNGEDYFLDESTDPPRVVLFPKGTDHAEHDDDDDTSGYYEVQSPSLSDFMFSLFFFVRHIEGSPNHFSAQRIQDVEGAFDRAVEVLDRLGLPKHPRSGDGYAYYFTPDVSVGVHQPEGYGLGVELGGANRSKVEHVYVVLDDHLGFAPGSGPR